MSLKKILAAVVLAIVFQLNAAGKTSSHNHQIENRIEVEIDGKTYLVDTAKGSRNFAQTRCQSDNMNLITFQTPGKYEIISDWLSNNGYEREWFWTGGLRDENSTRWYWEPTGNEISEFFWGPGQPTMNENSMRTCLEFRTGNDWEDDVCDFYLFGRICE